MKDYSEIIKTLRLANSWQFAPGYVDAMLAAADAIEELQKERDMVLDDIKNSADPCYFCKHKRLPSCEEPCLHCDIEDNESAFEWRGVTNENT